MKVAFPTPDAEAMKHYALQVPVLLKLYMSLEEFRDSMKYKL